MIHQGQNSTWATITKTLRIKLLAILSLSLSLCYFVPQSDSLYFLKVPNLEKLMHANIEIWMHANIEIWRNLINNNFIPNLSSEQNEIQETETWGIRVSTLLILR